MPIANRISWLTVALFASFTLLAVAPAEGNAPPIFKPENPPPPRLANMADMKVSVVKETGRTAPKLITLEVPASVLKGLVTPDVDKGEKRKAEAGAGDLNEDTAVATGDTGARNRTIIAGVAISLAVMFGGVALFRQRQDNDAVAVREETSKNGSGSGAGNGTGASKGKGLLVLLLGVSLGVGVSVTADIPAPIPPRPAPIKPKPAVIDAGSVKLRIVASDSKSPKLRLTAIQMRDLQNAFAAKKRVNDTKGK